MGWVTETGAPRALFVLYEWLLPTIIDSQVLLLVRDLVRRGFDFEIWSFCTAGNLARSRGRLEAARALAGCEVRVFSATPQQLPFSLLVNAFALRQELRRSAFRPEFVHSRADYAAAVATLAAGGSRLPVIWDCRGDAVSEAGVGSERYPRLTRAAAPWLRVLAARRKIQAGKGCAGALFVSEELLRLNARLVPDKVTEVIPCSVPDDLFYFDPETRREGRETLGLGDKTVLLYSGGTASYQGLGKLANVLRDILADRDAILLAISPDTSRLEMELSGLPAGRVVIRSALLAEMNRFCNVADFGLLIRDVSPVNRVASPTKFGEYCMAGLPVICNAAVAQAWEFGGRLGNRVPLEDVCRHGLPPKVGNDRRSLIAASAVHLYSRQAALTKLVAFYAKMFREVGRNGANWT